MLTTLLFVLYFLVVVPLGWVSRVVRDPMRRRWRPAATTYWMNPSVSATRESG